MRTKAVSLQAFWDSQMTTDGPTPVVEVVFLCVSYCLPWFGTGRTLGARFLKRTV